VVALASACSRPHVTLPAVSPNMTAEQRVQMFNELHATGERTLTTTSCGGGGGCSTNVQKTLYLANGTQVHHPEDLLPVVGPESVTARAVGDVHKARRKALGYAGISLASAVGFITIALISISGDDLEPGFGFSGPAKLGMLATGAGVVVGSIGAWYQKRRAAEHWGVANESYNVGLGERLAVCTSGFAVVPCESGDIPPKLQPGMVKPIGR
jgi:hypothetical protein